ncbi:AtpZ/AtpI family protein [Oricola sp.]|uniref:AtpZ/AtpI family protein n=1 Tax=Oricola sp. TaxID=1979950 RepID=UPI003BAA93EE
MAQNDAPGSPGGQVGPKQGGSSREVDDLESRRKSLDEALAARRGVAEPEPKDRNAGGATGVANALKLSSEFVAGVLVGAGIGYLLDRIVGTTPWGMIVFLLLGFAAGVLNVLRSVGVVAEPENRSRSGIAPDSKEE